MRSTLSPSSTSIVAPFAVAGDFDASRRRASTSGVILSDLMPSFATGSIHTVCQMPLTGVYQMPCGLVICLPRACVSAVVSVTPTIDFLLAVRPSARR